jgi:acetylglutamate kinase
MILKLEAAKRALTGGVGEVHIVGGTIPRSLFTAANGSRRLGTRVLPTIHVTPRFAQGAAR